MFASILFKTSVVTYLDKRHQSAELRAITPLKMLGLYLYTFIIGHKAVNMLRILNK